MRVVDVRSLGSGYAFAVWDTVTDSWVTDSVDSAWDSLEEFVMWATTRRGHAPGGGTWAAFAVHISHLLPDWVPALKRAWDDERDEPVLTVGEQRAQRRAEYVAGEAPRPRGLFAGWAAGATARILGEAPKVQLDVNVTVHQVAELFGMRTADGRTILSAEVLADLATTIEQWPAKSTVLIATARLREALRAALAELAMYRTADPPLLVMLDALHGSFLYPPPGLAEVVALVRARVGTRT